MDTIAVYWWQERLVEQSCGWRGMLEHQWYDSQDQGSPEGIEFRSIDGREQLDLVGDWLASPEVFVWIGVSTDGIYDIFFSNTSTIMCNFRIYSGEQTYVVISNGQSSRFHHIKNAGFLKPCWRDRKQNLSWKFRKQMVCLSTIMDNP